MRILLFLLLALTTLPRTSVRAQNAPLDLYGAFSDSMAVSLSGLEDLDFRPHKTTANDYLTEHLAFWDESWERFAHFAAFGTAMVLFPNRLWLWVAAAFGTEIMQSFVPHHGFEWADLICNLSGIATAFILYVHSATLRRRIGYFVLVLGIAACANTTPPSALEPAAPLHSFFATDAENADTGTDYTFVEWVTATERLTHQFILEECAPDGNYSETRFAAQGHSDEPFTYSLSSEAPLTGRYTYALLFADLHGETHLLRTAVVHVPHPHLSSTTVPEPPELLADLE